VAITIDGDPIISAANAATLTGWSASSEETIAGINAASAAFRNFTGRLAITEQDALVQVEKFVPAAVPVFYLRATPVEGIVSFLVYDGADLIDTLISGVDYDVNITTGRVAMRSYHAVGRDHHRYYKITFAGGWSAGSIPGDVTETAVEYMKLLHQRRQGLVGVTSTSMDGMATTYTASAIPAEIRDIWQRYKVY
jgi:hypothetical protein